MKKLREWTRKHSGVYCLLKFMRQFSNYDFREYLLSYRYNMAKRKFVLPDCSTINLTVYQRGELNPGKIIYEIPLDTAGFGFCSQIIVMLNRVNFAETMGMVPCINWYESKLYKEEGPVNGTTNIFEYYYEPIAGISVEEAEQSRFVVYDDLNSAYGFDWAYIPLVGKEYNYTEADLEHYGRLMNRYFHLKKNVEAEIEESIEKLFQGRRVLGVHGRGGDMKLAFLDHPIAVTGYEYAKEALKAMRAINADCVFLATNDIEILQYFQSFFGEKLLYYSDVIRSPGRIHNAMIEVDRPLHHYWLGYEMLRDVYTLAKCEGIVTGLSMVNGMARILKKMAGEEYKYHKIIDKGRHQEGVNVNDPDFLKKDAEVIKRIKAIQMQTDLSEESRMEKIEQLLNKIYGEEIKRDIHSDEESSDLEDM